VSGPGPKASLKQNWVSVLAVAFTGTLCYLLFAPLHSRPGDFWEWTGLLAQGLVAPAAAGVVARILHVRPAVAYVAAASSIAAGYVIVLAVVVSLPPTPPPSNVNYYPPPPEAKILFGSLFSGFLGLSAVAVAAAVHLIVWAFRRPRRSAGNL
jgi:hypothetical protein